MKVYCLILVSAFCVWNNPVQSQWFYSHYTQFAPQPLPYTHFIPQQTYNFATPPQLRQPPPTTGDYRGFGYHTSFQDGASSTVYFVTGPDAFANFKKSSGKAEPPRARNLASDITDSNAIPDISAHLQSILQPAEFQQLFDSRSVGVVNFYYPADTVPLLQTNNGTTELTTSPTTTSVDATTTTTTTSEDTITVNTSETEAEPAESIVENTRLRFNVIEDNSNSSGSSSTTPTTTTTTTTTTVSIATTTSTMTEADTIEPSTETTGTPENPETTTAVENTTVV